MRRSLRIIVPLLLILTVLASTVWYFLIYDRDFTKELILWSARTLEQNGKHEAAAWVYDLAYSHSQQEDAVAIELAQQYVSIGNYTKAEFTLTEAISKKPTANLYIYLSQLYVAQDKLLDATHMLDSITNPEIYAQLQESRPQMPTVSHEPGFYNQYISVSVESSDGTLYVNNEGEYPSVGKNLYSEPISLPAGETVLYCLAVGENGLVSPLGLYGYTVGGVVEDVEFTDEAIESSIRQILNVGPNTTIYTNDLWPIQEFTVPAEAASYTDLAYLSRLVTLTVDAAQAGVLAGAGTLVHLENLTMTGCDLSTEDLETLETLTNLKHLVLSDCGLSSTGSLAALTALETLDLTDNAVRKLDFLSGMTQLQKLYLGSNALVDLSAASVLSELTELDVSYNSLSNLSPIGHLVKLTALSASHNTISQTDSLKNLTNLTQLDLSFNSISDISSLAACTKLKSLNIANNSILDVAAVGVMDDLENFNMANNQVAALPVFSKNSALVTIDASYNLLTDVEALRGMSHLNTVNVDYNAAIESLEPLDSCYVLIQVNAYGTLVTDVTFLTEKSIVVNYNPTLE